MHLPGSRPRRIVVPVCLCMASALLQPLQGAQPIIEYNIPTANSAPFAIVSGSDGALWFTEAHASKIGRITTAGVFTEYVIPTAKSKPIWIVPVNDNAPWFTENSGNKIGRVTTAGTFLEFPLLLPDRAPWDIISGPDGSLWFTEHGGRLAMGTISLAGLLTEYPLPLAPWDLGNGPDGAVWYTEWTSNYVARMDPLGLVTNQYAVPTPNSNPNVIVAGPDGQLWFTEY